MNFQNLQFLRQYYSLLGASKIYAHADGKHICAYNKQTKVYDWYSSNSEDDSYRFTQSTPKRGEHTFLLPSCESHELKF